MRRFGLLFVAPIVATLIGLPVAAQTDVVVPADSCVAIDHSGQNPFNSPSAARWYLTLPPEFSGTTADLSVSGASGDIFGSGTVGPDGLTIIDLPLFSFGDHTVTEGVLDSAGANLMIYVTGLDFVVDASEPTCDPAELLLFEPEITTTTTIVETTTTQAATAPETTTTVAETTTTTSTTTTTTPAGPEEGGTGGFPWIPFGAGIIILVGGYIVYRGSKDPCEEELAAWLSAQAECDAARARAETAEKACDDASEKVRDLEEKEKEVCKEWPPACWDSDDGGWIQNAGDPSSRITQRDLHMRRMALGGVWDEYKAGNMSAQEVEEAWKNADTPEFREEMRAKDKAAKAKLEQVRKDLAKAKADAKEPCKKATDAQAEADAACAKAAAAKAAYDACMGAAAAAAPPPPTGGDTGGTEPPPTTGGGTPGTTPPPTEPPSGSPEDEHENPVCCPCGTWAGYGWTTGGILGFGVESTIVHFICLCDTGKYITLASRSLRAGLALGGETYVFAAYMWDVQHTAGVPAVWADKSAAGWDGDLSLGPSVAKGLKNVVKDAGLKQAGSYLKWAAKNKVPPSALDPRKLENLARLVPGAGSVAMGTGRAMQSQRLSPQLIVIPFGAGLQAGVWHKWCESVRVGGYESCGCVPVGWP